MTGATRLELVRGFAAAAAAGLAPRSVAAASAPMLRRPIPSTGELLPVIGLGTWRGFDVGPGPEARRPLREVLAVLAEAGGTVVDSSPMYGASEAVVGDLLAESDGRGRTFLATKVWTRGREAGLEQMRQSLALLRTERIDLMQVHNLLDWQTQLASARRLRDEGRVRLVGVTHYTSSAYAELEAVMRSERLDAVQVNYALDDRAAERRILPLAADRGMAVIVNRPFGGGGLLGSLSRRPLPPEAAELGCGSWAQLLLKFALGHPSVTCVIPGTSRAEHMRDNAGAGAGPLPDARQRDGLARIVASG